MADTPTLGIMSSLLLEIVNVYPALSPPSLTAHASNRVCNALALLQCVASHSETRGLFLNGESGGVINCRERQRAWWSNDADRSSAHPAAR